MRVSIAAIAEAYAFNRKVCPGKPVPPLISNVIRMSACDGSWPDRKGFYLT
jgi:hypothetical protein